MDVDFNGTRPLDFMIPKFLSLASHPSMRSHAVARLSFFVPIASPSLFNQLDAFIATLFKLATTAPVCGAMSARCLFCCSPLLAARRPEKLMPETGNVAEYMLYSTKVKNVALEVCEFTFAEKRISRCTCIPCSPK